MRITVKSEVEVWTPDPAKPPNGAWRAGVVTWGNGHSYIMRWLDGSPESGRIKRQFVRPCPPPVPLPVNLAAGDTVEVFDNNLWKLAEVVGVGAGNLQYDVKITGSTKVLTADRIELRVQQRLTEDDVWVVVNKDNHEQGSAVPPRPIAGKHVKSKAIGIGTAEFASPPFKLGLGKRSHTMVESDIVRDVKRFHGNSNNKRRLFAKEEEEPVARHDDNIEVIDVHPTSYVNKQQQQQPPPQPQKEASNSDTASSSGSSSDDDGSSSDGSSNDSSDGSSSSSSNGSNRSNGGDRAVSPCQDQSAAIQQLPVSCNKNEQCFPPDRTVSRASAGTHHHPLSDEKPPLLVVEQKEQYQEEQEQDDDGGGRVHDLEVEAYVNVMKAFHASGSLDWEKEELLSNLRVHFHISGDEHLQVIWHLNGKTKQGQHATPGIASRISRPHAAWT